MISLKPGARVRGMRTEILFAHTVVASVFAAHGLDCVVTSASDGKHSAGSRHYSFCAIDYRTRHITAAGQKKQITRVIDEALGEDFDVVLEDTHLHVEYDPKSP